MSPEAAVRPQPLLEDSESGLLTRETILLIRNGCIKRKNVDARRGGMDAASGPNIARSITHISVCF